MNIIKCFFSFFLFIVTDELYAKYEKLNAIEYFGKTITYQHLKELVDEAHNLLSRSRDMYSASISYKDTIKAKKYNTNFI